MTGRWAVSAFLAMSAAAAVLSACLANSEPPQPPDAVETTIPPKTSPDTAVDYRPDLDLWWATMPAGKPENLMALLEALSTLHPRLATEEGRWVDGDITLGAEPREYVPSDVELIAAELCRRIGEAVEAGDAETIANQFRGTVFEGAVISRPTYRFRHADVFGMGRYFYAAPAENCEVVLPR